jgi:hypothetical protein
MELIGIIVMLAGVAGFAATWLGFTDVAPLMVWGGLAVVGMIITILTRRPGD